jgi:hypothetical protein
MNRAPTSSDCDFCGQYILSLWTLLVSRQARMIATKGTNDTKRKLVDLTFNLGGHNSSLRICGKDNPLADRVRLGS